ncbi:MAG TPA: DUF1579 family protein [Gemmatimonadaceae bacterium]|nr:DUF1579 family protein [Gemmatimonadaceae bacterium]
MSEHDGTRDDEMPRPDPALARLDRLVGTWRMTGRPLGADADSITGTTTFAWLHGTVGTSFFLQQDMEMDYAGTIIRSREIIGYDPATRAFSSYVYSNMAPDPWPYRWDIQGDELTIAITYGSMDATFHGRFAADGNSFSGGWRPNPGADETINAPYDVTVTRIG